jgi:hypothetical protein
MISWCIPSTCIASYEEAIVWCQISLAQYLHYSPSPTFLYMELHVFLYARIQESISRRNIYIHGSWTCMVACKYTPTITSGHRGYLYSCRLPRASSSYQLLWQGWRTNFKNESKWPFVLLERKKSVHPGPFHAQTPPKQACMQTAHLIFLLAGVHQAIFFLASASQSRFCEASTCRVLG